MRHNFVTLKAWNKALFNFTSVHCAQKQQRAPLLDTDRNTVERNCKALGVAWPEPPDHQAEVIAAPHWIPELVEWMSNLRREDLPLKELPAFLRRLFQACPSGEALQARLGPSNTVTVNLDHYTRQRRSSAME
jgi:hypothetical protein